LPSYVVWVINKGTLGIQYEPCRGLACRGTLGLPLPRVVFGKRVSWTAVKLVAVRSHLSSNAVRSHQGHNFLSLKISQILKHLKRALNWNFVSSLFRWAGKFWGILLAAVSISLPRTTRCGREGRCLQLPLSNDRARHPEVRQL